MAISKDDLSLIEGLFPASDSVSAVAESLGAQKRKEECAILPENDLSAPFKEFQGEVENFKVAKEEYNKAVKDFDKIKKENSAIPTNPRTTPPGGKPVNASTARIDKFDSASLKFNKASSKHQIAEGRFQKAKSKWKMIRDKRSPNRQKLPEKNPQAIVPNWTELCDKEIFFNERTNEWSIVIFTKQKTTRELLTTALVEIFDQTGLVNRFTPVSIEKYIDLGKVFVKDTFVPTKKGLNNKTLCAIPLKSFNEITEDLLKVTPPAVPKICTGYFTCITRTDYNKLFTGLTNILTNVGKDYEMAVQNNAYDIPGLRFSYEVKKINLFKKQLNNLFVSNNISIDDPALEKIGLMFNPTPGKLYKKVESVWVKYIAEQWRTLDIEYATFSKKFPANDKTTLSFILHMPTIYRKYLSDNSPPFSKFISDYYYPFPVTLQESRERTRKRRRKEAQTQGNKASFNVDTLEPEDIEPEEQPPQVPVPEINPIDTFPGNEIQGMVSNFLENFNDSIPSDFDIGFNWDQRKKLEGIIFDNDLINKRTKDSLNRIQNIADPIINKIKENLDEAEKLKDLYEDILDPLSIEGLVALLQDAIANLAKSLPLEDVIQKMTSSVFEALDDIDTFDIFRNTVGGESLGETATKIERAFVDEVWPDLFPDIPLPNTSELFQELTSHTHYDPFDPLSEFDICLGTPGFQQTNFLGNIKVAFVELIDRELVPATEIADVLNSIDSIADKDAIKKIFEFSQTGASSGFGSNIGSSGITGAGSTIEALGGLNGGVGLDIGSVSLDSFGSLNLESPLSGLGAPTLGGLDIGSSLGVPSVTGRGFSPDFKLGAPDVKDFYKKNLNRKKPRLNDLTLPFIPEIPTIGLGDLGKIAVKIAIQKLEIEAMKIAKKLLKKVIDAIFTGNFPPSIDDILGSNSDAVRDVLKNQLLQPGASDDTTNAAVNNLLDAFSIWDPTESVPTDKDLGDFLDNLSNALSNQQIIDLFNGRANDKTLCDVRQAMNDDMSKALSSNGDIDNMFASIGTLLDRNSLQAQKDLDDLLNAPGATADLCKLSPDEERARRLIREALGNKSIPPEEADKQAEADKGRLLDDLGDLVKALADPEGILTNTGQIPTKAVSNDPRKPEDGIFPMLDEETKQAIDDMFDNISNILNALVITDLTTGDPNNLTSNGFLDMVLADNSGRSFYRVLPDLLIDGPEFEQEIIDGVPRFVNDHFMSWHPAFGMEPYDPPPPRTDYTVYGEPHLVSKDSKRISNLPSNMQSANGSVLNTTFTRDYIKSLYQNTDSHFKLDVKFEIGKELVIKEYEQDRYWHKDAKEDQKKKKKRKEYYAWTGNGKSDDPGLSFSLSEKTTVEVVYPVEPEIDDFLTEITVPKPSSANFFGSSGKESRPPYDIFADWLVSAFESTVIPAFQGTDIVKQFSSDLKSVTKNVIYEDIVHSITKDINSKIANNQRGWYAIPVGQKYVSEGIGVPTQVPLDPAIYGEDAFYIDYISETDEDGEEIGPSNWIELYLAAAPMDIFGKKDPLFDFIDLAKDTKEYFDVMPDDIRLESPNVLTLDEPPFCRINSRINNAGLAGMIPSVVRLSLYEALLKGTPAFQMFAMNQNNCKSMFVSYIVDKIIKEIRIESEKVRKIYPDTLGFKGYYYIFLEQTVQTYANLINLGFEVATPDIELAFDTIKANLLNWDSGDDRNVNFKLFIDEQLPSIKRVLAAIVRNELEVVFQKTRLIYRPAYCNLLHYALNNSDFIANNEADLGPRPNPPWIGTVESLGSNGKPLAIEKYIKLISRSTGEVTYCNQEQAVNILSYLPGEQPEGGEKEGFSTDSTVVGPAIDPGKLSKFEVFGGLRLSTVIHRNEWQALSSGDFNVLPMVYSEIPFNADQVKNFDAYWAGQILGDMWDTTEFKVLFERCFPISDIFASRTIYIIESLVESLTDRKLTGALGVISSNFFKIPTEFDLWNGRMFETSRKYLKSTIQQYYYGRTSSYVEETFDEITASTKASNAVSQSIVSESMRELDLSRKEKEKLFTMPSDAPPTIERVGGPIRGCKGEE